jgi:hypothetical protein
MKAASLTACYIFAVNIERTIEFILQSQAKAEARADRHEARIAKQEARIAKEELRAQERERKLDRRMDAIAKLIQQGTKAISRTQIHLDEISQAHKELAQAQAATERTLKAFIASSRNGKNGRSGH